MGRTNRKTGEAFDLTDWLKRKEARGNKGAHNAPPVPQSPITSPKLNGLWSVPFQVDPGHEFPSTQVEAKQ